MRSLRPLTRDGLEFSVRRALFESGYDNAAHIVCGDVDPCHLRMHIFTVVPPRFVRLLEDVVRNETPLPLVVSFAALGYCHVHDDCRAHEDLSAACWASSP